MRNISAFETPTLSSVDNALRLLKYMGERRVLRITEASAELGVGSSTAHRLLSSLKNHGFVVQDKPNGPYRPGPSLTEVAVSAIGGFDIRRASRAVLEDLRDEMRETVSLLMLEARDVRFVDCFESPRSVRVGSRTGLVLPAHCTAGGKAILAALAPAEFDRRYAEHELEVRTTSSIKNQQDLIDEIEIVRERGYAVNFGEGEDGISAVSVAIQDLTGAPLFSIAVAVPSSRLTSLDDAASLVPQLEKARSAITDLITEAA